MLKRKLQIFVSSTYEDLKEERQAAVEAILRAKHIPAGMELFNAGDKSQWETITRWIDESDAYMLILGGRYGSVDEDTGKSYTQLEYEYALSKNKPRFALIIREAELARRLQDRGQDAIERKHPDKMTAFRDSLTKTKLVGFWSSVQEIKYGAQNSISDIIEYYPDLKGWVPGDEAAGPEVLTELSRLSSENARLASENSELLSRIAVDEGSVNEDLAQGEDVYEIACTCQVYEDDVDYTRTEKLTIGVSWNRILSVLGTYLLIGAEESIITTALNESLDEWAHDGHRDTGLMNAAIDGSFRCSNSCLQAIKLQLVALEMVISPTSLNPHWTLTEYGKRSVLKNGVVKRQLPKS